MQGAVLLVLGLLLTSCAFFKLKEDLQMMKTNAALSGEIINRSAVKGPLTVILYEDAEGKKQIRNAQVLSPSDNFFFFIVPVGDYYIAVFQDANLNLSYDEGETFGLFGQPDRVHVEKPKGVDDLNFEISRTAGFPADWNWKALNREFCGKCVNVLYDWPRV